MLFVLYLISVGLPRVELVIRQFHKEYPNFTVCESTMTDDFAFKMPYSYMYVKGHFGGLHKCTHVEGNLVLRNIWPNPDEPDLSFLESIVEISGMVVMKNNSLNSVILPNLRVIRGEQNKLLKWRNKKVHPVSLYVKLEANANSSHAIFPSLRAIMNNSVYFYTVEPHSHLPGSILWEELFENPEKQKLLTINQMTELPQCHETCSADPVINLQNHCWSTSANHCQRKSKCIERRKDGCKWCYFKPIEAGVLEDCCSENCAGGCFGKTNSKCSVCKDYIDNATCVNACAPNFKLRVGMMCAKSCPENLLQEGDSCIYKCTTPQFYRMNNKCLLCHNAAACAKRECMIKDFHVNKSKSFFMTKEILSQFSDCEHVIGKFHFTEKSFNKQRGGITAVMLYQHLRKLKYITGNLMISGSSPDIRNLTFLENLIEIRHQQTTSATAALNVISTSLQFLGLRRLRHIYGRFETHNNSELCYLDTLPWNRNILISNRFSAHFPPCPNKTCDAQCGDLGCWGPTSTMCYSCTRFRAGANCVTECEQEPGFYSAIAHNNDSDSDSDIDSDQLKYDNGTCRRCHPLCLLNCTGPGPDQCVGGCRYFTEQGRCVARCRHGFFHQDRSCYKCNELCFKDKSSRPVCSGNGSFLGDGGCAFCHQFLKSDSGQLYCHRLSSCARGFYLSLVSSAEIISDNYSDPAVRVCSPCQRPCSQCSGGSLNTEDCKICDGYWSEETCVHKCDADKLQIARSTNASKECLYCHNQCRIGCHQPFNNSQCLGCRNRRLYDSQTLLSQFSCLESCPLSHNYSYKEERSNDTLCVLKFQWEMHHNQQQGQYIHRKIVWILGPVLLLLLLITLFILYRFYQVKLKKAKQYLKELYSNIQEPDSRILLLNKRNVPNMNRLLLIQKTDLHFNVNDKPLGTGAFGAVYKGQWAFSDQSTSRMMTNTIDVAIKVIQASRDISINDILEEMKVMASVSHKHCLRLIGVCLYLEMPCLVTTFVELGSLDKYLRKHKYELSSFNLLSWAEQIANGMAYLEMRNIIHRDLATRNVLLSNLNLVQITDFGLSQILQGTETSDEIVITRGQVPIRWLAIETLSSGVYSHKTDVWAYGVTLWEIFSYGQRPYDELDTRDISSFLLQSNRLPQPEICSLELYGLILRCWLEIPQFRPGFEDLMSCLSNYTRHPTLYLHIANDSCLILPAIPKKRLDSQCSYELHQFPRQKGIYQQQSLDGTVSTFIGDYSDDLLDKSLRRQHSNFSWNSKKYQCGEETNDPKMNLLRYHSILSEDLEEPELFAESDNQDTEYLEPIRK